MAYSEATANTGNTSRTQQQATTQEIKWPVILETVSAIAVSIFSPLAGAVGFVTSLYLHDKNPKTDFHPLSNEQKVLLVTAFVVIAGLAEMSFLPAIGAWAVTSSFTSSCIKRMQRVTTA